MLGYFKWVWDHTTDGTRVSLFLVIYMLLLVGSYFVNGWITIALLVIPVLLIIFSGIMNSVDRYKEYKSEEADKIVNTLSGKQ